MVTTSAGILLYRTEPEHEVLIAHMGGPFWSRKDAGAWSIPKGELDPQEQAYEGALREFREELGVEPPAGPYVELGTFRVTSSKLLVVFAAEAPEFVAAGFSFGEFELEWPPRSGRIQLFPEVDRAEWTPLDAARERLVKGQHPVLDALAARLDAAA
ncbi:DNA mismatch repair protein MutT [Microbacterium mangrovi]|uniref:DNA mismatch repair protein MutT n=1 Tax=Microbacterium mangrovi TaxID=1348253 RepID=A0A0B2A8G9_9MICO|nr:NUDIX domain-containing protein [Microbacterium mangrovi]KHK99833.1 DNA mismatch repair protein MutT [Microbacterium mangrovi]